MATSTHGANRATIGGIFLRVWWHHCRDTVTRSTVCRPGDAPTGLPAILDLDENADPKSCRSFARRNLALCSRDNAWRLITPDSTAVDLFIIDVTRDVLTNVISIANILTSSDSADEQDHDLWSDGMMPAPCLSPSQQLFRRPGDVSRDGGAQWSLACTVTNWVVERIHILDIGRDNGSEDKSKWAQQLRISGERWLAMNANPHQPSHSQCEAAAHALQAQVVTPLVSPILVMSTGPRSERPRGSGTTTSRSAPNSGTGGRGSGRRQANGRTPTRAGTRRAQSSSS